MKPGFDVCLHNKCLDLQMAVLPQKPEPPPAATKKEPSYYVENMCKWGKPKHYTVTPQHGLLLLAACHLLLFCVALVPFQLGVVIRNAALYLTPCALAHEFTALQRGNALMLHLAALYAVVMDPLQVQSIHIAFYVAMLLILSSQVYYKYVGLNIKILITLAACAGIVATLTLKCISAFSEYEALLDQCFLSMSAIVYATNLLF